MIFVGIDPGKKGGIAILPNDYKTHNTTMPLTPERLLIVLNDCILKRLKREDIVFVVEDITNAMSQTPNRKAQRTQAEDFGYIQGAIHQAGYDILFADPLDWKAMFDLIGKNKQASIDLAKDLFPSVHLKPTKGSKKDSDGMAEALLIAEYGRRYAEEVDEFFGG